MWDTVLQMRRSPIARSLASHTWSLVASYCLLLSLSCSPPNPQEAAQPPEGTLAPAADADPPVRVNTYDIDVSLKRSIPRERPAAPYRNDYEFTPENDWFGHMIPVWNVMLDEFKGVPGLNYLEVGCYEGRSSVWMLENVLTHKESGLTCIDPFLENFGGEVSKQRFISNVSKAGGAGRFDLIVGYSQIKLRRLPLESFDLIYIDGDHRAIAVLEDAVLSWGLLKSGGLIIFDDYDWQHEREPPDRPLMALDFFAEVFRPESEVIHRDYQLMLRKKY